MTVAAVVPVKNPATAKSRLASLLDDRTRRGLVRVMLDDVLSALQASRLVSDVFVVADDDTPAPGTVNRVPESRNRGYNAAIATALSDARVAAATAMLIVPADLPLVDAGDIDRFVEGCRKPAMRIVASRDGDGTNALLLAPPDLMPTVFGAASFARHCAAARQTGASVTTVESPGLAFDIDTDHDLHDFCRLDAGSASLSWLRERGVVDRLRRAD